MTDPVLPARLVELLDTDGTFRNQARVAKGELPARYAERWAEPFLRHAAPSLVAGSRILDVGSGRRPAIPREALPAGAHYVGLDVNEAELLAAPAGSYDEIVVADVGVSVANVSGSYDLILSWQVFEHVRSLEDAAENLRHLLSAHGRLVFLVSGRYAAFSLLARIVPHGLRVGIMAKLLGANPDTKFPVFYDRCYAGGLEEVLGRFSRVEILPCYRAAGYFGFWRPLEALYLAYENWLVRSAKRNLATHYVVLAVR